MLNRRTHYPALRPGYVIALTLLSLFASECRREHPAATLGRMNLSVAAAATHIAIDPGDPNAQLAARDPLAFLKMCVKRYDAGIQDYRCRFKKYEPALGCNASEQEMDVLFRERPFSVEMNWVRGADKAQRVTYVEGRWTKDGKEYAHVEPAGLLALLAPNGVKRDIHAADVRSASRRPIDMFGFRNTLELAIRYAEMAIGQPGYSMKYAGLDTLDGRVCYVVERRLPFSKLDDPYPDRLLVVYVDREWLLPTGCYAFADDERKQLLGSYVTTDVQFNVGLTDADF